MAYTDDPFAVKAWGGDIRDRSVTGWSWRAFEGTSIGEPEVGSLKRVLGKGGTLTLGLIVILAFLVLVIRVIWLQGLEGSYWRSLAEGNRIRFEVLNASRGLIVDRKGQVMAHNVASFRLLAVPAELPRDEIEQEEFLTQVLADVPTELLHQDNITKLTTVSYLPLVIASPLPHDLALRLMTLVNQGTGLRVEPFAERAYVGAEAVAHTLGYVGAVSQAEYEAAEGAYRLTDVKGKVGVEEVYEQVLRGIAGWRQVEVDATGVERKVFATQPATAGARLQLSLDSSLQQIAYAALKKAVDNSGRQGGSLVVMNSKDGSLLALVSYPSFDPNVFTIARNTATVTALLGDEKKPLFNRALAGKYPPGSTIKPLVAAAALAEGVITPQTTYLSSGGIYAGNQFFADWKAGGHGLTNVYKAIAESVNTFFYLVAGGTTDQAGLGITRLADYFSRFGLGAKTGLDLIGEEAGFVPTPFWKLEALNDRWYRGDTYNVAIGQGNLQLTPLQLAVAYTALATDGRWVRPHLLEAITYPSGETRSQTDVVLGNINFEADTLSVLQAAMRQTVTLGSARSLNSLPLAVAGKTGTAQTGTKTNTHAWFAGYAPADNPEIVVVVMVEYGGEGSSVAVPVARDIFNWYAQESK